MNSWRQQFDSEDIFFVTPDVKKGLGFAGILPRYHIICSYFDPLIPILREQGANIFCLSEAGNTSFINNSAKLLEAKEVKDYIVASAKTIPKILFFKPSLKLELLISELGFVQLGNTSQLNESFENKLNLPDILFDKNSSDLLPSTIDTMNKLSFKELVNKFNLPFVVQFGHGWAGKTTFIISGENEFTSLSGKYPFTKVKVTKFTEGFTVLNNCCIYKDKVMVSPPATQIDGIEKLCAKKQITCGRQWPAVFLDRQQIENINRLSQTIGQTMKQKGYEGFFGVDFLIENKSGKVYVSEINARLTASSAFYTRLELGKDKIPLMAYHVGSFLNLDMPFNKQPEPDIQGSQIILKNKNYNLKLKQNTSFAHPVIPSAAKRSRGIFPLTKRRRSLHSSTIVESVGMTTAKLVQNPGVYKIDAENKVRWQRSGYSPEKLSQDEFIYFKKDVRSNDDNELTRIETKEEVLDKPHKLSFWIDNILQ